MAACFQVGVAYRCSSVFDALVTVMNVRAAVQEPAEQGYTVGMSAQEA